MHEQKDFPSLEELEKNLAKLNSKPNAKDEKSKSPAIAFDICIELVSPVIAGGMLGYYIDYKFSTQPVWLIICLLFGIVAGGVAIARIIKRLE